jgi:hypothetical protein
MSPCRVFSGSPRRSAARSVGRGALAVCSTGASTLRVGSGGRLRARWAVQQSSEATPTALLREDPLADLPRWTMANMLRVAAFEHRDPVACFVLTKRYDPSIQGGPLVSVHSPRED